MNESDPNLKIMRAALDQFLGQHWNEWLLWVRYQLSQTSEWTAGGPVDPPPAEINERCSKAIEQIQQTLQQTSGRPVTPVDVLHYIKERLVSQPASVWIDGEWYSYRRPDIDADAPVNALPAATSSSPRRRLHRRELIGAGVVVATAILILIMLGVMWFQDGSEGLEGGPPAGSGAAAIQATALPADRPGSGWSIAVKDERQTTQTILSTIGAPWIQVYDPSVGRWHAYPLRFADGTWCLPDRDLERRASATTARVILVMPPFGSEGGLLPEFVLLPIRFDASANDPDGTMVWCDDPATAWAYTAAPDPDPTAWASPFIYDVRWPSAGAPYRDPLVVDVVTDPRVRALWVTLGATRFEGIRRAESDPSSAPDRMVAWYVTLPPPANRFQWQNRLWVTVVIDDASVSPSGMLIDRQALVVPETLIHPALTVEFRLSPVPVVGPAVCLMKIRNDDTVAHTIERADIAVILEDGTTIYPMTDTSMTIDAGAERYIRWVYRPTMKEVRFRDGVIRWEGFAPPAP
jgi:hypothetical protein